MNNAPAHRASPALPATGAFAQWQARVRGTNINEQTLLATDYLNHFSEVAMLIEMIPDAPELLETAQAWRPKTYQEHFAASVFSDKDLAIAAYDHVPPQYRAPFEATVAAIDQAVLAAIEGLVEAVAADRSDAAATLAQAGAAEIGALLDRASAIINGTHQTLSQDEIDRLI